MNAVVLVVVALVTGSVTVVTEAYPTAEECFAVAANVVAMEEVLTVECKWVEIEGATWRVAFGENV